MPVFDHELINNVSNRDYNKYDMTLASPDIKPLNTYGNLKYNSEEFHQKTVKSGIKLEDISKFSKDQDSKS